jgi:hypothetical protein
MAQAKMYIRGFAVKNMPFSICSSARLPFGPGQQGSDNRRVDVYQLAADSGTSQECCGASREVGGDGVYGSRCCYSSCSWIAGQKFSYVIGYRLLQGTKVLAQPSGS